MPVQPAALRQTGSTERSRGDQDEAGRPAEVEPAAVLVGAVRDLDQIDASRPPRRDEPAAHERATSGQLPTGQPERAEDQGEQQRVPGRVGEVRRHRGEAARRCPPHRSSTMPAASAQTVKPAISRPARRLAVNRRPDDGRGGRGRRRPGRRSRDSRDRRTTGMADAQVSAARPCSRCRRTSTRRSRLRSRSRLLRHPRAAPASRHVAPASRPTAS